MPPPDYKPGVAGLYSQLGMPCIPVALNSGPLLDRLHQKPGTIVVEFLPAIPPGLKRRDFMAALEGAHRNSHVQASGRRRARLTVRE